MHGQGPALRSRSDHVLWAMGCFRRMRGACMARALESYRVLTYPTAQLRTQVALQPMLHTASGFTALFLIAASAFLQGMPLSELSDEAVRTLLANGFSTRYAYSASFWLFSDSLTFSLVPVERRISWIVCMSAIWSVLSSAITY